MSEEGVLKNGRIRDSYHGHIIRGSCLREQGIKALDREVDIQDVLPIHE